jgi:hypothetical protein
MKVEDSAGHAKTIDLTPEVPGYAQAVSASGGEINKKYWQKYWGQASVTR